MSAPRPTVSDQSAKIPNGSGAAAILAAGIGSFMVALLAIAADKATFLKSFLNFYRPTGPLSGVTTVAVLTWVISWAILQLRWRCSNVDLKRVNALAFTLLILSIVMTFPPIADLF